MLRDSGCPLTRVSPGGGFGPRAARVARDRLKSAPAQILYLEGLRAPARLFLAARGMPTRIVARLLYLESNHRLSAVNRWLCRAGRVARILADIDPGSLGDAVAARQLRHKLTIVPSGHDPDWYPMSYELSAFGIPPGAFSVAAVSDGVEHPGMTRLIECVRDLPMDVPIHFLLLAPEQAHEPLRRLIRKHPFTQRFHLSELRGGAPGLLACCSVIVVTAWEMEIQRRACMQGLVAGVPIVAETSAPLEQLIRPGENGELLPRGDTQALAHSLFELYESPERRARLRSGAFRLAERVPPIDRVVDASAGVFRCILSGERKPS